MGSPVHSWTVRYRMADHLKKYPTARHQSVNMKGRGTNGNHMHTERSMNMVILEVDNDSGSIFSNW